jgi:hypothetical protein
LLAVRATCQSREIMLARTRNTLITVFVLAIAALAAYWYWSPFLALRQMQSAARAHDADAFNRHVDYPRLRDSLKGQMAARMAAELDKSGSAGGSLGALGTLLGGVMADKLVDMLVRPDTVMRAMQSGQFGPKAASADSGPATGPAAAPDTATKQDAAPKWAYVRSGFNQLIAYPADGVDSAVPSDNKVQIVFERSGFAHWKLTGVRL